jgi:hypothetical protein
VLAIKSPKTDARVSAMVWASLGMVGIVVAIVAALNLAFSHHGLSPLTLPIIVTPGTAGSLNPQPPVAENSASRFLVLIANT